MELEDLMLFKQTQNMLITYHDLCLNNQQPDIKTECNFKWINEKLNKTLEQFEYLTKTCWDRPLTECSNDEIIFMDRENDAMDPIWDNSDLTEEDFQEA